MNLTELFATQAKLDKHIADKHNLNESELFDERTLACLVELAEQANETQSFKYWKQNKDIDRGNESEELVDILHFLLSLGNLLKIEVDESFTVDYLERAVKLENLNKQYISLFNLISNISLSEELKYKLHFYKHAFSLYIGLTEMLGYGWGFIEIKYHEKVEKNYERQEVNY